MINPEHEIGKSFTQIRPKLGANFKVQPWGPDLQDRMRANYTVARIQQGRAGKLKGKDGITEGRETKEFTQASLKSVQNMNRRKKRVLP